MKLATTSYVFIIIENCPRLVLLNLKFAQAKSLKELWPAINLNIYYSLAHLPSTIRYLNISLPQETCKRHPPSRLSQENIVESISHVRYLRAPLELIVSRRHYKQISESRIQYI